MSVGFYFNMMRCTGCRACQVACKDKNRLLVGDLFRNAHTYSVGEFPSVMCYSYSASCNHCDNAACVENCPTGAMNKLDDGTVAVDKEVCIGCSTCVNSCPYGVPHILPEKISGKCDGCYGLRAHGEKNACVAACPTRALDFGDIEELKEKYGSDLVTEITIHPDGGTMPNTLINAKEAAMKDNPVEIMW